MLHRKPLHIQKLTTLLRTQQLLPIDRHACAAAAAVRGPHLGRLLGHERLEEGLDQGDEDEVRRAVGLEEGRPVVVGDAGAGACTWG